MTNKLNFEIVGSGPTGMLLAIALSKLNLNIYLTDLLTKEKLINKDKTYALTHSTRKILSKFNLWHKIESYLYSFDSLTILDSEISAFSIFNITDLDEDICSLKSIGWVVKHSDLIKVFFEEIEKKDNIFFSFPFELNRNKIFLDYKFISTGANSNYLKNQQLIDIKKQYYQSCLTFEVLIRGNLEKRAYEIFREEGPLALLPLDKNRYQIIWTASTSKSLDRLNSSQNFLLDNLSSILPKNFIMDQIVSEVNIFPVSLSFYLPFFDNKKLIFVGDSFHTFHPVGGQGLNTCWRDVNNLYDILSHDLLLNQKLLNLLKYKYYLKRIFDILSTIVVTDLLIKIFANKNPFLLPIRKMSFFFLNKFSFIRKIILNHMTKSFLFSSIK